MKVLCSADEETLRIRCRRLIVLFSQLQVRHAVGLEDAPIRIGVQYPPEQPEDGATPEYDCIDQGPQYIKLGQPTTNTKLLQICDSQDVRNPFKIVRDPDNLETNCWHRCTSTDRVSNAAREWMRDIINEVMDDLQNTIRILWPVEEVQISGDSRDDPTATQTETEDVTDPYICPAVPISITTALPNGRLSASNNNEGHLLVYVTFRPNPAAVRGATTVCKRDGFGRPVIVHINLHAPFMVHMHAKANRISFTPGNRATAHGTSYAVMLHEMMHALALTSTSIQQFRTLSRKLRGSVVDITELRGIEASFLVTPNARFAVRQQYNIQNPSTQPNDVPGLEIVGYSAIVGQQQEMPPGSEVHLSPQVARSDVSSVAPDEYSVLSMFSLAVLNDTGWYRTVRVPDRLLWGLGRSQSFLADPPTNNATAASAYDCDASSIDSDNDGESVSKSVACSYDPEFKGFCTEPEEVEGVQAWTMSHFVAPLRTLGSCKTGPESPDRSSRPQTNSFMEQLSVLQFFNGSSILKEQIGPNSRCFMARRTERAIEAVCLEFTCTSEGVNITLGNSTTPVACLFDQEVQAVVTLSGAPSPYAIVCPSKQEACPQLVDELPCPRDCSTPNGECNTMTGSCECNEGWTGDGCSEYICTGSECLAAGANEGEEAQGTCEDGTCSCVAGYTGVDCRVQQPQCDRDCSLLGEGYHCVGETCERQCSTGGDECVAVETVTEAFTECAAAFSWAETSHVCIPAGDVSAQASSLKARYQRELQRWRPNEDTADSQALGCQQTVERLACFTVFRECDYQTDIEWPLCLELCQSYVRNCGESSASERPCEEPLFRDASDSKLCSGSADPDDFLSPSQIFGIIFGSIVALLLVLLVLLLWLFRCWPCRGRSEMQVQPPQLGLASDISPMETPTDAAVHSSGNVLLPVHHSRDGFGRMCLLFRRPRRRARTSSGSSSNPLATRLSAAVYANTGRGHTLPFTSRAASSCDPAQSEGSDRLRSAGQLSHPPTAPSAISTAERPDISSNSHFASHPASVSQPSQLSHHTPGETPTEESVTVTPTSQHTAPTEFATHSYGAHTTIPQLFQPSAFSVADDPSWAHTSWQQHPEPHGSVPNSSAPNSSLPPTHPNSRKASGRMSGKASAAVSGASSGEGLNAPKSRTRSGHTPLSPTPVTSSPYASQVMSQPSGQPSGPEHTPATSAEGAPRTTSSIMNAISGSTIVLKGKSKGRMPGSKMLKRPARRRPDSDGTAPSARGEVEGEGRSDAPSSPTYSRSHDARSRSGERSPMHKSSTNLEGELSAVGGPSPHTSGNMHGAILSHASQVDASIALGRASSRRSGEVSPQRSMRDSGGLPAHAPSTHMLPAHQVPLPLPSSTAPAQVAAGSMPVAPLYGPQPPIPAQVAALHTSEAQEIVDMAAIPPPGEPSPAMRWQQSTEPQDPFLDDSPMIDAFGESTAALDAAAAQAPSPMSATGSPSLATGPVSSSITLQLPSFHHSKSMRSLANSPMDRGGAGSVSFRAALGSTGLGSFHSEVATSEVVPVVPSVPLERRQSDPFLAEPAAIEEEELERAPSWEGSAPLPDQVGSSNTSAQFNTLDSSVGGTALLGRPMAPLQRVSEASEVHEGMPATLASAPAETSNQSIVSGDSRERLRAGRYSTTSHDSEHSDPFLQETQNEQ